MAEYLKRGREAGVASVPDSVRQKVSEMLTRIEREGMTAIRHYSEQLDGWSPLSFRVPNNEIRAAGERVGSELREHIAFAQSQIRTFAAHQRETLADLDVEVGTGVRLGHRHIPVSAVGSYVPGGRYPMLASAFMTVLTAKVAGVQRVVAVAPPWRGAGIHPAMLYAMATSGADEILCIGGVQALGLLAFGGDDVEPVDMIVGAGNAYVAEAKRQLFGRVGIDLLAGPTEVLVIADDAADPELIAADLLGQAEHGPTSPAILVSLSRALVAQVEEHIARLLASDSWASAEVAGQAWADFGTIVLVESHDEAIRVADEFAPEHLEVQVESSRLAEYRRRLTNYGGLFLGEEATVVYGDKAVGTNHVLPTMRAARYTGGLWVGKFLKTVTWQQLTDEGTRLVAPAAAAISDAELFGGHALTARLRLERLRDRVS